MNPRAESAHTPAESTDAPIGRVARVLGSWTNIVTRRAWLVVLLVTASGIAAGLHAIRHLGIDTDTVEMLSAELPWRIENERHKRLYPHYADNIVVVVRGATPELAAEAQRRLGERLRAEPERFEDVHLVGGGPFFRGRSLLYLETEELEALEEGLEEAGPWLLDLERQPGVARLLTVVDSLLAQGADPRALGLLGAIGLAFEASMVDRVQPLPWRSLMTEEPPSPEELRRYIEVLPELDFAQLLPAEPAIERIRVVADSLGLTARNGVSVRLTGFLPMSEEELRSAGRGLWVAGLISLVLVAGTLYVGLRSGRLILAALATLLVGLSFTAAFAALAVGRLNLISMAFAVLYIGLGIDYAIHYCLRYRELRCRGSGGREALRGTSEDVGASLLLSAVTTAACFYAFIPTDFSGVSELGLIGGTGMLISFATTITLLPAILGLAPFRPAPGEEPLVGGVLPVGLERGLTRPGFVLAGAALVAVVCLALLPRARFDLDPLSLRNPEGESTSTFLELLADSSARPLTVSVLAADREEAWRVSADLEALGAVEAAVGLDDFVPGEQETKLDRIGRIARLIGPAPEATEARQAGPGDTLVRRVDVDGTLVTQAEVDDTLVRDDVDETLAEVDRFRESLRALRLEGEEADVARFVVFQLRSWQRWMEQLPPPARERVVARVEESLLGELERSLRELRASFDARPVTVDSLPGDLVARWRAADGTRRVEVIPRDDLADPAALRAFVAEVRTVAPDATGEPVINVSAGEAVVTAFRRALAGASVATLLLLVIALRSVPDAARVMLPLLLAAAMTGAATVVFGIPFNYANVIAIPLLLGVGVDNGIHMVHRDRTGGVPPGGLLVTSTARAVLYASLTTIFSFGSLAFSDHPGTASMGRLLTIGMLAVLVCTLLVLPALRPFRLLRPSAAAGRGAAGPRVGQV